MKKRICALCITLVIMLGIGGCNTARQSATPAETSSPLTSPKTSSTASSDDPTTLSNNNQTDLASDKPTNADPNLEDPSPEATPSGTSYLSIYQSVLLNKTEFFSSDANKNLNVSQLSQAISTQEVTVDITNFAVLDIGHDGTPAVVLSLNVNDNPYGFEVLSYQDEIVYGYTFSLRQFGDLRTDGTFLASGGAADVGICTITFDKGTYSIDQFTYSESTTDSQNNMSISYFVNHQSVTEDAYNEAFSQWQKIPLVTWYDFTDDEIEALPSTIK